MLWGRKSGLLRVDQTAEDQRERSVKHLSFALFRQNRGRKNVIDLLRGCHVLQARSRYRLPWFHAGCRTETKRAASTTGECLRLCHQDL